MPIYEYKCQNCDDHFDVTLGVNDKQPEKCSKCNGVLVRLISAPAFHLKGGGWYKDGYSSAEKKESKPAPSTDSASKKVATEGGSSITSSSSPSPSSEKIAAK
jgi:putative FmdB family regulatory protein